ncbi:MAG: HAMP domain-containing sensor histidine kinase [Pirellulales bacterium]
MISRRSLSWPVTLGVSMILLLVALAVGWIIVTARSALEGEAPALYWTLLAVGTIFLVLLLVGVVVYLLLSIKSVRLTQRQSNFIDSVTHELKSPIASLKLYLQTLTRRKLSEEQAAEFHRAMLEDLERLDSLINHLLDAARIGREPTETPLEDVDLAQLLGAIARTSCQQYHLADDAVELRLQPVTMTARPTDLEMIFRNLIDNALKYSGPQPKVEVNVTSNNGRVTARISDNGPGIPINLRRKIFGRFVRLGSELERKQAGMGLGLFIVRQLVRSMRGKITVRGRGNQRGTVFEVELPRQQ